MKIINKNYFTTGSTGLSQTSANHIANLAKELVKQHVISLKGLHFVEEAVCLLGHDNVTVTKKGTDEQTLCNIPAILEEIGEANSLIAWLREAIKMKKEVLEDIEGGRVNVWEDDKNGHKNLDIYDYLKANGFDRKLLYQSDYGDENNKPNRIKDSFHEYEWGLKVKMPTKQKTVTSKEIVATWTEAEQSEYASLNAIIPSLEQYQAEMDRLVAELDAAKKEPQRISSTPSGDMACIQVVPTVGTDQILTTKKAITQQLNGYQQKLLAYKERIEEALRKDEAEKEKAYSEALMEANKQEERFNALYAMYIRDVDNQDHDGYVNRNELKAYRMKKTKEIEDLKIVIPESLKAIYEKVAALGK